MRSPYSKVFVLSMILVVLPWRCYATTVVVFITPKGIVVGADSKPTISGNGDAFSNYVPTTDTKVFLVRNRFIISHTGLGMTVFQHGKEKPRVIFRFQDSVNAIRGKVSPTMSIRQIAGVVQDEIKPRIFEFFDIMIQHHWISAANGPANGFLDEFLIAGYDGTALSFYDVSFTIDWARTTVVTNITNALHTDAAGFQLDVHGINSAIQQITDVMSEPHRFAFKLAPAEMKLVSDQKPVSLAQAITATKVLIRTEANFTPKHVGLPAKVIVLEPPTVPAPPINKSTAERKTR